MRISRRFVRWAAAAVVGAAVLVLSPWYLFGYHFDADDLRAAVEGTWQLTVTPPGAPAEALMFRLVQGREASGDEADAGVGETHAVRRGPGLVRPSDACGHRSLVRTAGACMDVTEMPLEVTLFAAVPRPGEAMRGGFMVDGTRFEAGWLTVAIGDVSVQARVAPGGKVQQVSSRRGQDEMPATLVRIAR